MKKSLCIIVSAIAVLIVMPRVTRSDETGWNMPNLNPFASKGQAPTSRRMGQPPTSGWQIPTLLPTTTKARPKRQTNQPTTWNRMTSGPQKFISKTADALTPWDNKKPAPPQKITGSNSIFTHNQPAKKESTSSSVAPASWWSTEKSNPPPKTVNGFLSQPRP